jgi:hypothetical protein
VLEVFSENEAITFDPGSPSDLAIQILRISKNPILRKNSAESMKRKYENAVTQDILTRKFLEYIGNEN